MTIEAFAIISLYAGFTAYLALTAFFLIGLFRGFTAHAGLAAAALTALWFATMLLLGDRPIVHVLENGVYVSWILLLANILGLRPSRLHLPEYRPQTAMTLIAGAIFLASAVLIAYFDLTYRTAFVALEADEPRGFLTTLVINSKLALTLLGIIMIEQVARNVRPDFLWNIKFIIIGLATIFIYGFILFAEAMLFRAVSSTLLAPQGVIYAAAVPLIALGSLRNRDHHLSLNVSRRFVFRTGSIVLAGSYLLIMSAAGYYVQIFGGQWGDAFLVILVAVALIGLALLALSRTVRHTLRMAIVTNLFQYKYDYREEWLQLNKELTTLSADDSLALRAIRALAQIINTPSGAYWRRTERDQLIPCEQYRCNWNQPFPGELAAALIDFYRDRDWIIDLAAYRDRSGDYPGLELDLEQLDCPSARLIVPLFVEDRLFGVILLREPDMNPTLNWEDYDILKMIAQQAAGFLALRHLDEVLAESEQLRTMHQLSAFIVHDLKTVSAQMSLLLRNAQRHKDKPGFVDDMLATVQNSASRIERLLTQLREARSAPQSEAVDLVSAVDEALGEQRREGRQPQLERCGHELPVQADAQKLSSVIGHVVQNAQEAITEEGSVALRVSRENDWAKLEVSDDGKGMSEQFVANELFAPFSTTKGVAGIGIGAYQTREYIRSLGGDVKVDSTPGKGTRFTIRIPLATAAAREHA